MSDIDSTEQFVQQITENQNRLYGYVFSMLGDHTQAADVLQETNLVLWRKKSQFRSGEPFLPWAFAIARFQVLAHVRDRGRDRCVLDGDLVEVLALETEKQAEQFEGVRRALHGCIAELTETNRDLVRRRYFQSLSIDELSVSLQRGASAVKVALLRIRRKLADCVERKMVEA